MRILVEQIPDKIVSFHAFAPLRSAMSVAEVGGIAVAIRLVAFGLDTNERRRRGHEAVEYRRSPPRQEKQTVGSRDRDRAGQDRSRQPGSGGSSSGRWRKKSKVLAASAEEDFGLSNLLLAISFPGAVSNNFSMSAPGTPGRNLLSHPVRAGIEREVGSRVVRSSAVMRYSSLKVSRETNAAIVHRGASSIASVIVLRASAMRSSSSVSRPASSRSSRLSVAIT